MSIVEGHGEVNALPSLLHRIALSEPRSRQLVVNHPIRVKAGSFLNDSSYFRKYISLAAAKAKQDHGFVLILLDCEDECPAELGATILTKAQNVRNDVPYKVFLAYREYESWFITAIRSLRGQYGIPDDVVPPQDVEAIRDAKGWLTGHMSSPYDPVNHQTEFSKLIDLQEAQSNASFKRLYHRLGNAMNSPVV